MTLQRLWKRLWKFITPQDITGLYDYPRYKWFGLEYNYSYEPIAMVLMILTMILFYYGVTR